MTEYLDLQIGSRKTSVSLRPDPVWSAMWRVHQGERASDMVNFSRAKDAAITWARPRGLGSSEVARWHRRESAAEACYGAFSPGMALGSQTPRDFTITQDDQPQTIGRNK